MDGTALTAPGQVLGTIDYMAPELLDGERVVPATDIYGLACLACETLTGPDLKAVNTFADPRRVVPQRLDAPAAGSRMTFKLPPRSYTVAHLATKA